MDNLWKVAPACITIWLSLMVEAVALYGLLTADSEQPAHGLMVLLAILPVATVSILAFVLAFMLALGTPKA